MEKPFRWCFIGTGTLAEVVTKTILPSGRHVISAVYSRRFEKAQAFAKKHGAVAYETAAEAISAPEVDAVYVVTPHNSHYEYTKLALSLGKPVLCEKAFTTDAKQAKELIDLSREKQLYLAEAMWTWFSPVAWQVKKWLDDGEYGTVQKVSACYHMKSKNYAPRVSDPKLAGGALLDVGVYPITYLYRLFGKPVSIRCSGVVAGGIDEQEEVELTFPGGQSFVASASIVDFKGLEHFSLQGEKAKTSLWFYHGANKVKLKRRHGKNETFKAKGGYLNEFDCVAREIQEGLTESRPMPLSATLDVMEIMDECRRQMGLVYPFERGDERDAKD